MEDEGCNLLAPTVNWSSRWGCVVTGSSHFWGCSTVDAHFMLSNFAGAKELQRTGTQPGPSRGLSTRIQGIDHRSQGLRGLGLGCYEPPTWHDVLLPFWPLEVKQLPVVLTVHAWGEREEGAG